MRTLLGWCLVRGHSVSAFHSLCDGVKKGRFPDLRSRDELWSLLLVIASRKAAKRRRAEGTLKRDCGHAGPLGAADEVAASEPTPEFAALLADEIEHLLSLLGDDELRAVARGKLEGQSNEDLASTLGYTVRTVERRLALIRRTWSERATH